MDSNISILQSGRGLIRETELPIQELELKLRGGGGGGTYLRDSTVYARVHTHVFMLCKRLISRHDRTAIIGRSRCHMEETSFGEAMSNREAQPTLIPTR